MFHHPKALSTMLAILCFFPFTAVRADAQQIRWTRSPLAAVDSAQQSGKMLLVSVGAEWCHYCKKMDKEVWPDHSLVHVTQENYVPLKLNDEQHKELVQALQIQSCPTTLVFTSDKHLQFDSCIAWLFALDRLKITSEKGDQGIWIGMTEPHEFRNFLAVEH